MLRVQMTLPAHYETMHLHCQRHTAAKCVITLLFKLNFFFVSHGYRKKDGSAMLAYQNVYIPPQPSGKCYYLNNHQFTFQRENGLSSGKNFGKALGMEHRP